jgi:hypothetical protein
MFLKFNLIKSENFCKPISWFFYEVCFEIVDELYVQQVALYFLHLKL